MDLYQAGAGEDVIVAEILRDLRSAPILIVVDHPGLRRALQQWLNAFFPAHPVVEAINAAEALALAQANSLRVAVVDMALTGLNGLKVVAALKAVAPGIRILVLTNDEVEIDLVCRPVAQQAEVYLSKVMLGQDLQSALVELLHV